MMLASFMMFVVSIFYKRRAKREHECITTGGSW